ncbi:MAG TPA: DUF5060 domain-containing protein [Bacteroides sp.]|nr:DUF5060 domain-containing protein [Bacteroides sp.]
MNRIAIGLIFIYAFSSGCNQSEEVLNIEKWGVYELVLSGPSSGDPFIDVDLSAVFKNNEESIAVPGFYDGNGIYRIRFSPHSRGEWTYKTESNLAELSGKKGGFHCVSPAGQNHGPVKIVNTFYLQYADGSPYYAVGTTAYQWTSVAQSIQLKTLETLAEAPFNKIRMCVFPKSYRFGNDTEPWMYPFGRQDDVNDYSKPNYEFFQNFDLRVEQLLKMGIEADVILFHPYDAWGYSQMGDEMNSRYVRYMIARSSAYRNVWWSLANEWDVPRIKDTIDWEGIGTLIHNEDPHQRLRGIHNWHGSEDHFYDHSRPWITHTSTQTSQFYNAIKWRDQYEKPLLFDEMRYEGGVPAGWGRLSAEKMASYFWMAGLSGGYGTHGDTYQNSADDSTEVRWWAKGGYLVGDSPERIRFFRSVMEQAPVTEMTPDIFDNGDPTNLNTNMYLFSKKGEYYLAYIAEAGQNIEIILDGDKKYTMEIIDTWNMQIVEQKSVKPGVYNFTTVLPYTALRLITEPNDKTPQ